MRTPRQKKDLAAPDNGMSSSSTARNEVACSAAITSRRQSLQHCPGVSDSKHSDAVALAVDLATNGSWSETFSPSVTSTHENMYDDSMSSQQPNHSSDHTEPDHTDLGPPPEYSPSYEQDMTATSDDADSEAMQPSLASLDPELFQELEGCHFGEVRQHDRTTREKLRASNFPWMRKNNVTGFRRHRLRWLHTALWLLIIVIAGCFMGYFVGERQNTSSQRNLPFVSTQRIHIQHNTTEDIRGRFELYDKLELSTTTGAIDIEIDLQPGNGTAELILSTRTGAIRLGISDSWWSRGPKRTLRSVHTEIKTVTGTVYGRILLGQGGYASVDSVTGEQALRVYVYNATPDDEVSELVTRSHVGNQVVALTHFGAWDTTISTLKAKHHSLGTASLDLQYSHAWRGEIHAVSTAVGDLEVHGDVGLVFDKKEFHEVLAHKGKDTQRQTIEAVSDGTGAVCFKSSYTW